MLRPTASCPICRRTYPQRKRRSGVCALVGKSHCFIKQEEKQSNARLPTTGRAEMRQECDQIACQSLKQRLPWDRRDRYMHTGTSFAAHGKHAAGFFWWDSYKSKTCSYLRQIFADFQFFFVVFWLTLILLQCWNLHVVYIVFVYASSSVLWVQQKFI